MTPMISQLVRREQQTCLSSGHSKWSVTTQSGSFLCMLSSSVQYQDGQKRRKPNYSSVDLSEVEWEDKDDNVCISLIIQCTRFFVLHVTAVEK